MRIAYYIWETFTAGGLQRITIDKANLLAEMGHSVLLITSNQSGRPAFWHISPSVELCDLGIDYQAANAPKASFSFSTNGNVTFHKWKKSFPYLENIFSTSGKRSGNRRKTYFPYYCT